jgi:hypothetical protein
LTFTPRQFIHQSAAEVGELRFRQHLRGYAKVAFRFPAPTGIRPPRKTAARSAEL